jgi:hypothetical protein
VFYRDGWLDFASLQRRIHDLSAAQLIAACSPSSR